MYIIVRFLGCIHFLWVKGNKQTKEFERDEVFTFIWKRYLHLTVK